MRRLFSSFARGWPGLGILLARLVVAIALVHQAFIRAHHDTHIAMIFATVGTIGAAISLFFGLWTPIGGALASSIELWNIVTQTSDLWTCVLLATFGIALALLGPGAWSIDARLFGWKRIDIPSRDG
jgi:putative oxidoreductase